MPNRILHLYIRSITVPARLTIRLTSQALKLAGDLIAAGRPAPSPEPAAPRPEQQAPSRTAEARPAASAPAPAAPAAERPAAADYDTAPLTSLDPHEDAVKTIDDEPELVGEFAEPGAEEGAGASLQIDEPWQGYQEMNAEAVIARLDQASAAEVAMVELYERANRQRSTVLAAAERRLQTDAS